MALNVNFYESSPRYNATAFSVIDMHSVSLAHDNTKAVLRAFRVIRSCKLQISGADRCQIAGPQAYSKNNLCVCVCVCVCH